MSNMYQTPLPAAEMTATYAVKITPMLERMADVLAGSAQSCALPINTTIENPRSPCEYDYKNTHQTFTRQQVREMAIEIVTIMSASPSPTAVQNQIPSYAVGAKASDKDLAHALRVPYEPSKGKNAGLTLSGAGTAIANYRFAMKRMAGANAVTNSLASGTAFFVNRSAVLARMNEGADATTKTANEKACASLLNTDGTARAFAPTKSTTMPNKNALKAVARLLYGANWHAGDKKTIFQDCQAFVYAQGESVGKPNQSPVNRYTLEVLRDTHQATVRRLAKEAGAPADATKSKALASQWFSDNTARLEALN